MTEDSVSAKAASFLASLRGGESVSAPALPAGEPPPSAPVIPTAPSAEAQELLARLDSLEAKLQEVAKAALSPDEGEPPRPPTELMLFLQTRMELLERKLAAAQEEALRANLLLREREEAQREARREVESLFKTMREQSRAAAFDTELRKGYAGAQAKVAELETKLKGLEGKAPPDEIARLWQSEEGRAEAQRRIEEQAAGAVAEAPFPEPPGPPVEPPPMTSDPGELDLRKTVALLTGRIADLETRLEEAHKERDQEKARRLLWEKDTLGAVSEYGERWRQSGGAQIVVESALENIVQTYRERDALAAEMAVLVDRIQDSPPDVPPAAERAALAEAQAKMRRLEDRLSQHMSLVQAWIQEHRSSD